ncbi:hypothetical protein ACVWXF_000792 [Thermostichus sp. MS-CIW-40]|jgi:hypothetical protein
MTTHFPQFALNFATGSASFSLSPEAAQQWHKALQILLERLKVRSGSSRQQPQDPVEFHHSAADFSLEMFCNPNIWVGPHAAKVLVTVKTEGLRFSTEVEFSRLQEDLSQYLESLT